MQNKEEDFQTEIPSLEGTSTPPILDPQRRKALLEQLLNERQPSPPAPTTRAPRSQTVEREEEEVKTGPTWASGENHAPAILSTLEPIEDLNTDIDIMPFLPPTSGVRTSAECYQDLRRRIKASGRVTRRAAAPALEPSNPSDQSSEPDRSVLKEAWTHRAYRILQTYIKKRPDLELLSGFDAIFFEKPNPMSFERRGPWRTEALTLIILSFILLVLFGTFNWKAMIGYVR